MPRVHVYPGAGGLCLYLINTLVTKKRSKIPYIFIGPVELRVHYGEQGVQSYHFLVDLDSVYKTPNGELVYSLDRVEMEIRNIWQLVIVVELIDGLKQQFTSKGFQIRTRPRPPPKPAGTSTLYTHRHL